MIDVRQRLEGCDDLQSIIDCVLSVGLELVGTPLGNVQLMNWKTGRLTIAAQRGFKDDFLRFFSSVTADHGSACARAIRTRSSIVIEDVLVDREFEPYRPAALDAGFRAVQSTPLISSSNAFLGVLSTHFAATYKPSAQQMRALKQAAGLAANAIIRTRALKRDIDGRSGKEAEKRQIATSREAVEQSLELLRRIRQRQV